MNKLYVVVGIVVIAVGGVFIYDFFLKWKLSDDTRTKAYAHFASMGDPTYVEQIVKRGHDKAFDANWSSLGFLNAGKLDEEHYYEVVAKEFEKGAAPAPAGQ